jgi:DcmR-like sensory protein
MGRRRVAVPETGHFHAVRFYENADSLARMVAGFVAEGLISNHPAIIFATPEHRHAASQQLTSMGFDIEQLKAGGELFILDAREMLATFMVEGMPDLERFEESMLPLVDRACRERTGCVIRAYGEMVDVLWKDGMEAAAIRLEMFWNQLAGSRQFSLMCGYSMGNFYKNAGFDDICSQHTHVVSPDGAVAPLHAGAS